MPTSAGIRSGSAAFNEITRVLRLVYWYTWQVSILGLGPIWQSDNDAARRRAAELLDDGAIFAFGLSEKAHGADIYSTDMVPDAAARRRELRRQRRQVLHRQRQPGGDGPPSSAAAPTSRGRRATSSSPPTASTRITADQERRHVTVLRLQLRARRLPGSPRGRVAHRARRVRRGAEHRQRRQVQPWLRLDRDLRARVLRGDHARRRAGALRDAGDRLPARASGVHRRLRPADRDEAVRRGAIDYFRAPGPTTGATSSTTRSRR